MKLQDLFAGSTGFTTNMGSDLPNLEIQGLAFDTRKVEPGFLFVAIRGHRADGHDFLPQAIEKGATALVVQDRKKVPITFSGPVIEVSDSRMALDHLAGKLAGNPSDQLFCVGVTGTNGKTSTTYLVEAILNSVSMPCGVIGTVDHHLGEKVWPSEMTTPDPVFLQKRLREFLDEGAQAVAMEISSHALDQSRADSVQLDVAIFTNLSRDHLDYHQDMETYFAAKQKLFLDLLHASRKASPRAIVNIADEWGRRLRISDRANLWTYGSDVADFRFEILAREFTGTVFRLICPFGEVTIDFPMAGDHNVQNAVAALAASMAAGVDLETAAASLSKFRGVPGRLQMVKASSDVHVFVDYAHSPDALENVLKTLQTTRNSIGSEAKIWTVFGCGGDRDRGKRPQMAEVAERLSDLIYLTSDNPRTEDPQQILNEMIAGLRHPENALIELDRASAIEKAILQADPGDVILIAGKGHEDYQIIGTEKKPFRDDEVARHALNKRGTP